MSVLRLLTIEGRRQTTTPSLFEALREAFGIELPIEEAGDVRLHRREVQSSQDGVFHTRVLSCTGRPRPAVS